MKRIVVIGAVVGLGLFLGWLGAGWLLPAEPDPLRLQQSPSGGDFTLATERGPLNLRDLRGKVVLVYFGYTFCPDICPTNLALLAQALNAMTDQERQQVQAIFVSVDPERDTVERLAVYAGHFHPQMLGATSSAQDIAGIAKRYGVVYRKVYGESAGGYLIDHSSSTYVIAPDGSLYAMLPHATPARDILAVTKALLAEAKT